MHYAAIECIAQANKTRQRTVLQLGVASDRESLAYMQGSLFHPHDVTKPRDDVTSEFRQRFSAFSLMSSEAIMPPKTSAPTAVAAYSYLSSNTICRILYAMYYMPYAMLS